MSRRFLGGGARFWALAFVLTLGVNTARAASWADRLFLEQGHDFGPVPRGAKVRHSFVLRNTLNEPVTILNVRASCGCTSGQATASLVQPGQSAAVEAEMDTRNFVGKKSTILYVTLVTAKGKEGEAKLGVSSMILSDIVLNPGTIDFGTVTRGQTPTLTLTVDRVGMPNWKVERMASSCRAIDASMIETVRNGQVVSYLLKVRLRPDAQSGMIRDAIRLVTNDSETRNFPIQVTGMVRGDLSASPSTLALGHVISAGGAQGRFLVRASKPFIINAIEGAGDGFHTLVDDQTPKPVHIVTVNYRPEEGTTRGDLKHTFRVVTDIPGESPLELTTLLHVSP